MIRLARPDDETVVVELWRRCGLVVSPNDPGVDFRFALAGGTSCVLVAEAQGEGVVGSVMVGHDGHRGWLYYVAATPSRRLGGIGRALVAAAEDWLRERGVPKVQLLVRDTNTAVVGFYERLGFETAPRVVMAKRLGPSEQDG